MKHVDAVHDVKKGIETARDHRLQDELLKFPDALSARSNSSAADTDYKSDVESGASLVPRKVTREELQRIIATLRAISREEFETLPTAYVGELSRLSLVINDKLKVSKQFKALAI